MENMHNIEYLEYKKNIIQKIRDDLQFDVLSKIRKSTKAYITMNEYICLLENDISKFNDEIDFLRKSNVENYTNVKIKTKILNEVNELKNELSLKFVSETIEFCVNTFKEYFLLDKLEKVIPIEINKDISIKLNSTEFYVCRVERKKEIIAYKIEDLFIYESNEFLNINDFKQFNSSTNTFLFSPKYTLQDIDKFIKLWIEKSSK